MIKEVEMDLNQDNNTIMVGDFNFPEIDWSSYSCDKDKDHPAVKFLTSSIDGFMTQHITEPTRWREGQRSNTLDLIFTNRDGLISDVEILPTIGKSDHGVLLFKVHRNFKEFKTPVRKIIWDRGNYQAMKRDFMINWKQVLQNKDVEESWDIIKRSIMEAINKHVPVYTFNSTKKYRQIWMTKECITKVKEKCKSWRQYMKTKYRSDKLIYSRLRNQTRWICRKTLKLYEKKVAHNIKDNPKAFWQYVNSKLKHKEAVSDLKTESGVATSDSENANELSNFFCKVFTHEDPDTIPTIWNKHVENDLEDI